MQLKASLGMLTYSLGETIVRVFSITLLLALIVGCATIDHRPEASDQSAPTARANKLGSVLQNSMSEKEKGSVNSIDSA